MRTVKGFGLLDKCALSMARISHVFSLRLLRCCVVVAVYHHYCLSLQPTRKAAFAVAASCAYLLLIPILIRTRSAGWMMLSGLTIGAFRFSLFVNSYRDTMPNVVPNEDRGAATVISRWLPSDSLQQSHPGTIRMPGCHVAIESLHKSLHCVRLRLNRRISVRGLHVELRQMSELPG